MTEGAADDTATFTLGRVGFLGAGNMARAMMQGLLATGLVPADRVAGSDTSSARRDELADAFAIEMHADNETLVRSSDVVILALKPQVLPQALPPLAAVFRDKLLVSVVAGTPIRTLRGWVGEDVHVIRTMPNTPALVREGATALAPGAGVTAEELREVRRLFEAVGRTVVVDERQLDAVTGLSGSGPAYVMLAIEALADGGVKAGLPREAALLLAAQTVAGAARLQLETGEHPAVLKDRVTSPAGTTISGVHALERAGFRRALMDAVEAAAERSRALGKG